MNAILSVSNLGKSFGGVRATDNVSIDVIEGEIHAIIGPNGAGKTTLVSQLCGGVKPDSGTIRFKGTDITHMPPYRRANLGMTRSFQITSLIMDMNVLDNVSLAIQARDGHSFKFLKPARSVSHIRDQAMEILRKVGLDHQAERETRILSHGEHRQLEIAVALASGARMMLLDEPMAGLGPTESAVMVDFLKTLKGSHSILLIEHDMDAVFALADRISVLVYGRIIATGKPDEIRTNSDVQKAYLGEDA